MKKLILIFLVINLHTFCSNPKKKEINQVNIENNIINNSEIINFKIINEVKDIQFKKTSIEIRLEEAVNLDILTMIALQLKKERSSFNKLWIFYFLPEHEIGNGAWATTHFQPELEVKILGATMESSEELNSKTTTGSIIGSWKDNDAMLPNRVFLVDEDNTLFIKTIYAKSKYAGEGGELIEKVKRKDYNGLVRYDYKNNHGEYYILENNGNLGLYNDSGKFKELIKEN
ncbi:hypothetical protein [Aquimarina celericrescens]|uniref:Uncharacterized protein n=1 Tax=Aquimarina celericrescens TaxID=1964542 RepID=A0ABW5B0I8_9FLAO|nr:hypothetical protein [Aquimarina celericrescens]